MGEQTVAKNVEEIKKEILDLYLNRYRNMWKRDERLALFSEIIALAESAGLVAWVEFARGMICWFENKNDEALERFNASITLEPAFAYPWHGKGNVLRSQKKLDEAMAAYEKAIALDPTFAYPWNGKGNVLRDQKKPDEALAAYDKAIALDPAYASPWYGKGVVLRNQKKLDEALAAYEKAIGLDPTDAYPWNGKGNVLRDQKKLDEALAAYDKAIALDPTFAYPWNGKGIVLRDQKKLDEAMAAYEKAIALDPTDASPWYGKGTVLADQKKFNEALAAFDMAIGFDPTDAYPWNGKGNVFANQNKLDEALAAYEKAIALDPTFAYPWSGKGNVLRDQKKTNEALAAFERAIRLDSDLWFPYFNAGILVEHKAISKTKALAFFEKAARCELPTEKEPIIRMWIQRLKKEIEQEASKEAEAVGREEIPTKQKRTKRDDEAPQLETATPPDATTVGSDFFTDLAQSNLLDQAKNEHDKLKQSLAQAYEPGRCIGKDNTLFVLRDWNSFTPILGKRFRPPDLSRPSAMFGGGYFFTWKCHGVAIDPGIDFITQLYNKKLGIADLDSIFVTHCHLDHFNDVEPLIDLNYRLNENLERANPSHQFRQLQFFFSTNANYKYNDWAIRTGCCQQPMHLQNGKPIPVSEHMVVQAVNTYHRDIVDEKHAVGLIFTLKDNNGSEKLRIGFTSDTRWDPSLPEKFKGCHVLIAHLGTVEDQTDFADGKYLRNHLGLRGCFDLMTAVRPKVFIVGEFGEELFMLRMKILKVLHKYRPAGTVVFAGDSNLALSLEPELKMYCSHPNCDGGTIPLDKLKPISGDDMLFRYYCEEHSVEEKK